MRVKQFLVLPKLPQRIAALQDMAQNVWYSWNWDLVKLFIRLDPEMWEAVKEECASRYPLGRLGQPLDVANCMLFLASDESAFITGQIIELSGGARL